MAIGSLRPFILLPMSAISGLSPKELETILMHEFAHIRRHDALVNLAQNLIEAVLFFHPVVWWISTQVRKERENRCDDLVVTQSGSRTTYIRALSRLEEARTPAIALAATGGALLQRVQRMAGFEVRTHRAREASLSGLLLALSAVIAICVVTPQDARTQPGDADESSAKPSLEEQRAANENAYRESADYLRTVHKDRWVVIAGGRVLASFEKWQDAVDTADKMDSGAQHRFVFRPGVDDGDEDFMQSPWMSSDPNWFQLGRRFRTVYPFTISSDLWIHKGRSHRTPDGRGWIALGTPGKKPSVRTRAVGSNLFEQDLSITGQVAETLGLERFSVPGKAFLNRSKKNECRKALCRVTIDDLGVDTLVSAFIIPQQIVDRNPLKVPVEILSVPAKSERKAH